MKKKYRRGREAAYLLAISERRLARRIVDLVVARQYLQDALSRENPGTLPDPRFLSEAIAIDAAKINFDYFNNMNFSTIQTEFESIWQSAEEQFSKLELELQPECKMWICQQLSTNLLDMALISYNANHKLPEDKLGLVRKILTILREKRISNESMELNDGISEFVYLTASTLFCTENAWKAEALGKLNEFKFRPSLPFDKSREKVFRHLAEQS